MRFQLPLTAEKQSFNVVFGTTKVTCNIRFNERTQVWKMDIINYNTQKAYLYGLSLVLGQDLLQPYQISDLNGTLAVIDTSGNGQDAGPDDLGTRVVVWWLDATDLVVSP